MPPTESPSHWRHLEQMSAEEVRLAFQLKEEYTDWKVEMGFYPDYETQEMFHRMRQSIWDAGFGALCLTQEGY